MIFQPVGTALSQRVFACAALLAGSLLSAVGPSCGPGVSVLPNALPFNFHVVADGKVYRSAQPTPETLMAAIEQFSIRTVINLRGENPDDSWWVQERAVCEAMGVKLVNIAMSAQSLPSRETLLALYDALAGSEYPILLHCQAGADRTGAAAAIWRMMQGEPREDAASELSPLYFHLEPFAPAMDRLVAIFTPDREWIANAYDPATMSQ